MSDAEVRDHLIDVMRAAGTHDAQGASASLQLAAETLQQGQPKVLRSIEHARECLHSEEWTGLYTGAYQAIADLAYVFPPAPETLPAPPEPALRTGACACGTPLVAGSRFCHKCGAPTASPAVN